MASDDDRAGRVAQPRRALERPTLKVAIQEAAGESVARAKNVEHLDRIRRDLDDRGAAVGVAPAARAVSAAKNVALRLGSWLTPVPVTNSRRLAATGAWSTSSIVSAISAQLSRYIVSGKRSGG